MSNVKMLFNQVNIKQVYDYTPYATQSYDLAKNMGYFLGINTNIDNHFNTYLDGLVDQGILTKVYDFTEGVYREGLYSFQDDTEIEFFGKDHMSFKLFYNY